MTQTRAKLSKAARLSGKWGPPQWRGAHRSDGEPSIDARETELLRDKGREAWRAFFRGDSKLSESELISRYSDAPDLGVVLCRTARQEAIELAYYELCRNRRGPIPSFEDFEAEHYDSDP